MKIIKYIDDEKKLNFSGNYILSALNLAFIGFFYSKKIKPNKYFILWPDGIFALKFGCKKKIPGRTVIKKLKINDDIKKIVVLGNCSNKEMQFLKLKYKKDVINYKLNNADIRTISQSLPKIYKNILYIITLPTPKQEQIAEYISKKYPNFKIICIGGGLKMCTEKIHDCPKILYNLGLEFIWRLRFEFKRRIIRLIYTYIMYLAYRINKNSKKIILERLKT